MRSADGPSNAVARKQSAHDDLHGEQNSYQQRRRTKTKDDDVATNDHALTVETLNVSKDSNASASLNLQCNGEELADAPQHHHRPDTQIHQTTARARERPSVEAQAGRKSG